MRESRSTVAGLIAIALLMSACTAPHQPDPLSAPVIEARAERLEQIEQALDDVAAGFDARVLGESFVDQCYEGQRNWKVDTGYDYRCSLLVGLLVGIDGDFRGEMLEADAHLVTLGWQSSSGDWPGLLVDQYWELRAGESPTGRVRIDRLPGPLSVTVGDSRLLLDYGSVADDRGLERIDRGQQRTMWCCGLPFYEERALLDVSRVPGLQPPQHLILLTIEGHYFET